MNLSTVAFVISMIFMGLGALLAGIFDAKQVAIGWYVPCVIFPFVFALGYGWLSIQFQKSIKETL